MLFETLSLGVTLEQLQDSKSQSFTLRRQILKGRPAALQFRDIRRIPIMTNL
jgi:hypothetical protein